MRIVCPSCEAEYEVPDTMLAGGPRKVRCARCAREWAPFAPPPPPAPEAVDAPEPAMPEPPPRPAPQPTLADQLQPLAAPSTRPVAAVPGGPPSVAVVIAWLMTAAIIAAGIGALWLKRPEIVHFWPPAARRFRLFGLE